MQRVARPSPRLGRRWGGSHVHVTARSDHDPACVRCVCVPCVCTVEGKGRRCWLDGPECAVQAGRSDLGQVFGHRQVELALRRHSSLHQRLDARRSLPLHDGPFALPLGRRCPWLVGLLPARRVAARRRGGGRRVACERIRGGWASRMGDGDSQEVLDAHMQRAWHPKILVLVLMKAVKRCCPVLPPDAAGQP